MVIFVVLDMKHNTQISTLHDFSHNIYFYCWKKLKKHYLYFHSKMAWPPPTYEVISRSPRNWPLLNSTQNAPVRWTNSYWTRQVLMFYPLRENSDQQNLRGWHQLPLAPPKVKITRSSFILRSRCTSCKCMTISPICSPSTKKEEDWKHGRLNFHYLRPRNYYLLLKNAKRKYQLKWLHVFHLPQQYDICHIIFIFVLYYK